ncbi:MAG: hypothetical protein Q3X43_07800 [Alistipes sp.]|uniref:hypothetical protein n=1 Tax=Alistipes TaxID=239759 RepID=UPI002843DDB9|nr:hypothetical protein [Alistipes sp.]MDR3924464.1 hypothetical protein [Alistipes sp.]MDR4043197.1 hypothetical protein [Alistipes sp.]
MDGFQDETVVGVRSYSESGPHTDLSLITNPLPALREYCGEAPQRHDPCEE